MFQAGNAKMYHHYCFIALCFISVVRRFRHVHADVHVYVLSLNIQHPQFLRNVFDMCLHPTPEPETRI
jgi:hypothetical protein